MIIQTCTIIKNKKLDLKMNFKTYLKILKNGSNILGFQTDFCSTKIKKQF